MQEFWNPTGPNIGNLRAGLVADATTGAISLLSGGLLCLAAVAWIGAAAPQLRQAPSTDPALVD